MSSRRGEAGGFVFQRALTAIGRDPTDVFFIDDKRENVEGARRVGLNAVVYHGAEGPHALRDLLRTCGLLDL